MCPAAQTLDRTLPEQAACIEHHLVAQSLQLVRCVLRCGMQWVGRRLEDDLHSAAARRRRLNVQQHDRTFSYALSSL